MPTEAAVKVTSYPATVVRIEAPHDPEGGFDPGPVAHYLVARGLPYGLALVILASPAYGEREYDGVRVVWRLAALDAGRRIVIEVTTPEGPAVGLDPGAYPC